jgi:predicted dithiol-disulfide oxidoreductase (DUF899 family)
MSMPDTLPASPTSASIRRLEEEIAHLTATLAQMRRSAPRQRVADCTFTRPDHSPVTLAQLFGQSRDLLVIHNMGRRCPYCTLWADGFAGLMPHVLSRSAFVLVSPDDPDTLARFAGARQWQFPVVSSLGTTFTRDLGFEPEPGKCWPGASGLHIDAQGGITRVASTTFGPGDDFCSAWHLFDLLAEGTNGWQPKHSY